MFISFLIRKNLREIIYELVLRGFSSKSLLYGKEFVEMDGKSTKE